MDSLSLLPLVSRPTTEAEMIAIQYQSQHIQDIVIDPLSETVDQQQLNIRSTYRGREHAHHLLI